jgi:hypothetical protein
MKTLEDSVSILNNQCKDELSLIRQIFEFISDVTYVVKHFLAIGAGPNEKEIELIKEGKDNEVRPSALITSLLRTHFVQDSFNQACYLHNLSKIITVEEPDVEDKLYLDLLNIATKLKLDTNCLVK